MQPIDLPPAGIFSHRFLRLKSGRTCNCCSVSSGESPMNCSRSLSKRSATWERVLRQLVSPSTEVHLVASLLPALDGQFCQRVAGAFLAPPQIGKKAMHIVSARGGQFVLDAPDFLEHQIASAGC